MKVILHTAEGFKNNTEVSDDLPTIIIFCNRAFLKWDGSLEDGCQVYEERITERVKMLRVRAGDLMNDTVSQ